MSRPFRSRRARLARVVASTVLALVASLAAAFPHMVRERVTYELGRAGFADVAFEVEGLSWDRVVLRDVRLPPDLQADRVEIGFDAAALVRDARLESIAIEGARWSPDPRSIQSSALARLVSAGGAKGAPPAVRRVRLSRSEIAALGQHVEVDGELDLAAPSARLRVRSPLGAHDVTLATGADGVLAIEARPREGRGAAVIELAPDLRSVAFRIDALAPEDEVERALPGWRLDGDPGIAATGSAHATEDGWSVDAAVALAAPGLDVGEVALEGARADLHARAELGATTTIEASDARFEASSLRGGDVQASGLAISGPVAIKVEGGAIEIRERAPLQVRADTLSIGRTRDALRLDAIAFTLAARDGPIATARDGRVELASRAQGTAARLRGALSGRSIRASGDLDVDLGGSWPVVRGDVRADAAVLAHAESDIGLARDHVELAIRTDRRGRVRADGRGRSEQGTWRTVPIGPTEARLAIDGRRLSIDAIGRATHDAPFAIAARVALRGSGGSVHVGVPMSVVRPGDPLHRVLVELVGLRVQGRAGGQVDADLRRIGAGTARLALDGADVELDSGRGSARHVSAEISLANLTPAISASPALVRWSEIAIGMVQAGRGSAHVRFEPETDVAIADTVAELGGGRVRLAPFRFDLERPEAALDVTLEDVEVRALASALSDGRLTATGRLDGHVQLGLRLDPAARREGDLRVVLGEGQLAARRPGRIFVADPSRVPPATVSRDPRRVPGALGRRVISALSDFEYSRLAILLRREDGATRAVAHVAGRGARTPQELDLEVRVRGLQDLLDETLRLWPSTTDGPMSSSPRSAASSAATHPPTDPTHPELP